MSSLDTEPTPIDTRGAEAVQGGEPCVLLVDDQPARLLAYESILEGVGVRCVRALSGKEALARLLHARFALILLDVSMPTMDGFETARTIRQHPLCEVTPIIFVTGVHVTELDTLKGYEAGAIDYISVPIVPEILRSKVALLVELYRRRAELETLNRELSAAREQLRAERESALAAAEARRETEEIRRLESEHAQLLDISSDAIFVWELDGVIQYWNKGASELYGFDSDEAVGRSSHELLSTVHAHGLHNMIEGLRRARSWRGELTHRTKSGCVLTVQSSMQLVVRGNQILVMESNRDLTERKRSEDLLREADRRKDEFLAVLSHELRNPLAPIRNVAEYLNLIEAPEQKLDWARRVLYRQVTHMSRILDDLLDVSRISRGRLILKKRSVSTNEVVDAAIETVRPLIDEKAHRLVVELPSDPPMLDGDPVRLTQVISNLLTNAVKYTDRGGLIELTGSVEHRTLCLCVKDNGIGIPPEQIPRLFTMFEQAAGTRDRSEGGLGIGLALAKGIIELHGGTIEAKSPADGTGSEFLIRLHALDAAPASVAASQQMPQSDLAKLRILIADDNRDAADSLALLLRLQQQEVRVAHDGRSALSIAHSFRPNIVLLDIGMPESNGYQVARALRQEPWAAGMCLIALTGRGRKEDERQALEAGFDFHLRKPYELRDLEAVIAAHRSR